MILVLKLLTLVSFLGGPLLLMDTWRPVLGTNPAFALGFAPLALLLFGCFALGDTPGTWRRLGVGGGVLGALVLLAQNAVACWLLLEDPAPYAKNFALYATGMAVGTLCAAAYLALARNPALLGALEQRLLPEPRRALLRDWALLAISAGFVAAGMLLWARGPAQAVVTIVFFGGCGIVPVLSMRRRWRAARELAPGPFVLPPDRTLRPRRDLALWLFGGLLAGGSVVLYFSAAYPPLFRILTGAVTALGALGLLAVALGWAPVGYVRFDDASLAVGFRHYALHVPWSALGGAAAGELSGQPAVFLWLLDGSAWTTTPSDRRAAAAAALARSESWTGAPIVIVTTHYGVEPLPLANALQVQIERARGV